MPPEPRAGRGGAGAGRAGHTGWAGHTGRVGHAGHWLSRPQGWRGAALSVAAGALAGLGQAPFGLWPALVLGLSLAAALLAQTSGPRPAARIGWAFGFGYFGLVLVWIVQPFLVDIARHGWMAPFAWALMAGGMALFWAGGFALARWLAPGPSFGARFGWLTLAVGLGAAELARAHLWTGFPWGGPGLAWIDTPLAGGAALVGAFGLTVASAALAGLFGQALALRSGARAGVGLALLGLAFALGGLTRPAPLPLADPPIRLRLVQPNAPQHQKWDPAWVPVFYDRALALTAAAAEGAPPDLVIWPETAVPTLLGEAPAVEAEIATAAAPAPLLAGIRRRAGPQGYNALVLFGPDGRAQAVYDKHHIVPFGEYVPLGNLLGRFGIHGMAAREGYGYSRGPGAQVMDLPAGLGTVLPLICYEAIFPRDLRAAPARADWIVQVTNDAWFGTFSGPFQHLVQARFRAIEFGLPLVRAANTGVSAVIDAQGHVTAALPLGSTGHLDADLPTPAAAPPYARFGDLPLVAGLLAAGAVLALRRRRETY